MRASVAKCEMRLEKKENGLRSWGTRVGSTEIELHYSGGVVKGRGAAAVTSAVERQLTCEVKSSTRRRTRSRVQNERNGATNEERKLEDGCQSSDKSRRPAGERSRRNVVGSGSG